ncbi:MAG: recombinase A [Myxococcales bacterium]|nr:recombinase A [Myxococcales bacterium]
MISIQRENPGPTWCLDEVRRRLVELVVDGTGASVTLCMELVLEAQLSGEPVAWVSAMPTSFSPQDAARSGIDTSAVAYVRVSQARSVFRAAERLLRCGAFGLVILDPGPLPSIAVGSLGPLVKLSQTHDAAVVCLTSGDEAVLGSLVSLRAHSRRRRVDAGVFECRVEVSKDKRRGPGWGSVRRYGGTEGLW